MRPAPLIVALLAGLALGVLLHALLRDPVASEPGVDAAAIERRLQAIEAEQASLTDLVAEVIARRRVGEEPRPTPPPRRPLAGRPAPRTPPPAGGPGEPFADHDDETLRWEARALTREGRDLAGAVRRWRALIERGLSTEDEAEAHYELGQLYRRLGEPTHAAEAFAAARARVAPDGAAASIARIQEGWSRLAAGEPREALSLASLALQSDGTPPLTRANAQWLQAQAYLALDDEARARAHLVALLHKHGDDPVYASLMDLVRERLDEIGR